MKDYPGSADHARTLASFVQEVQDTVNRQDIDSDRKVEIITQQLSGPNGVKIASQVGEQDE